MPHVKLVTLQDNSKAVGTGYRIGTPYATFPGMDRVAWEALGRLIDAVVALPPRKLDKRTIAAANAAAESALYERELALKSGFSLTEGE